MGHYKVVWEVEVDATDHLDAARKGREARLDPSAKDHHYTVDDGYTQGLIDLTDE